MFDLIRLKQDIFVYYFKIFNSKHNQTLVKQFISDWNQYVELYSKDKNFIRFDRDIPVLRNLRPNTKSLIITTFQNDEKFSNTTVFPICIFTAFYKNRVLTCKDSNKLLLLYLKIAKIKYVAFYKMLNYKKILHLIKKHDRTIKCYPPTSFHYFCKYNKIYKY